MSGGKWKFLGDFAKEKVKLHTGEEPLLIKDLAVLAISEFQLGLDAEQVRKIISKEINKPILDLTTTSVYEENLNTGRHVVGIIGDTHEPFTHKDYRNFCYEVFNYYKVDKVIHIGDEVDNHALSYHEHDPNGHGPGREAELAQKGMDEWYKTFPDVDVIIGNHSALPYRKATSAGIPKKYLKVYEDIWEAPKGWRWLMDQEIDHVLYTHGTGCSGQNGAINRALRSRQSTVIGHIHSFGGVNYHATQNDLIFGMNVGCGVDVHSYAFEYGKEFVNKPTLGCGIVIEGHQAIFVPMNLGRKFEWTKIK